MLKGVGGSGMQLPKGSQKYNRLRALILKNAQNANHKNSSSKRADKSVQLPKLIMRTLMANTQFEKIIENLRKKQIEL